MSEKGVILLVEDNQNILDANMRILEERGHKVLCAETLAQAREHLTTESPDLAVLDIMLPDGDGLDFMSELRQTQDIPVLFLTGKTEDKVKGLEIGGNDYITKPYKMDEFLARVETNLRWEFAKREKIPETITKGNLTLKIISNTAFVENEDLRLSKIEFALLLLFVKDENKILSAEYLYETAWEQSLKNDKNALQASVSRLRDKLNKTEYTIDTIRNQGYVFMKM